MFAAETAWRGATRDQICKGDTVGQMLLHFTHPFVAQTRVWHVAGTANQIWRIVLVHNTQVIQPRMEPWRLFQHLSTLRHFVVARAPMQKDSTAWCQPWFRMFSKVKTQSCWHECFSQESYRTYLDLFGCGSKLRLLLFVFFSEYLSCIFQQLFST